MNKYKIIVRGDIRMPWSPSDYDLQAMNCYYESPSFFADTRANIFDILDFAFDQYYTNFKNIRIIDSVELVPIS